MPIPTGDTQTGARQTPRFLDFALDVANARLVRGDQDIPLRPKTFAVLCYLADRPGELVRKQDLLAAVWPDTSVTEWVLTSCIRELRRALGDDSRQARIIQTVHRLGYRFIAAAPPEDPPMPASRPRATPSPLLVGRAAEIEELQTWLSHVLDQRRQLGFVVGEPGIGKTTILEAFLSVIEHRHPEILIAHGQCIDQRGAGEPYLPILEALGRLCRGPAQDRLIPLLRRHAPSWLLQFPDLIEEAEIKTLEGRVGFASGSRMPREMADFIEALGSPFVLVLEDLHWSDQASLDLLMTLARRRDPARLLVVGSYRPVDVAVHEHPLRFLHRELRGQGLCRDLWLQPLREAMVAEYVRFRWGEVEGSETLARTLHQHTDGNALFMVTVADALVADGLVSKTDTGWTLRDAAAGINIQVPQVLQGMIAVRNERLNEAEREVLSAGSVIGRSFSAALAAAALGRDVLSTEQILGRLAERGQAVKEDGESTWPDGTVSGAYRFLHAMHQTVIRESVAPALRRHLHARVAERMEAAYQGRSIEAAMELAFHFEAGGLPDRAVPYMQIASDRALRLGAAQESVAILRRGIALLEALDSTPGRGHRLGQFFIRLGRALPSLRGYTQPEIEQAYLRARALAEQSGDLVGHVQALSGLATIYVASARFHDALEAANGIATVKGTMPIPFLDFAIDVFHGMVCYHTGSLTEARRHLDAALAVDLSSVPAFSLDPTVVVLGYLASCLIHLGYPDQARSRLLDAAARCQVTGRPFDRASLATFECIVALNLRDFSMLATAAQTACSLGEDYGVSAALAVGTASLGLCRIEDGHTAQGLEMLRQGIANYRSAGHAVILPFLLANLGRALIGCGDLEGAAVSLAEARTLGESTGEKRIEVETYRLDGLLWLARGDRHAAEQSLRHAIDVARQQTARWSELRATTSLAQLILSQTPSASERAEVGGQLAGIVESLSEGHDTRDWQEASRALAQLAS